LFLLLLLLLLVVPVVFVGVRKQGASDRALWLRSVR